MSVALEEPVPTEGCTASGVRTGLGFLEINLDSLRIPAETKASVLASEARAQVELLADGTAVIRSGSVQLGTPLAASEVLSQLAGAGDQHVVVIFGIGTGQLARTIRSMCRSPIIVYEPDPAVLRALLEYGPLDLGNIPIVCGVADLTRVWREFSARLVDVCVMTTPGYYREYPAAVSEFVDAIPMLLQRTAISKATYQNRARVWIEDIIANVELLREAPPFLRLHGRYAGVPAFIIGAGPSLDKNIHLLRRAAQHGIIFATNSGAVSLAAYGIEPQVVVCIESIDASSKLRDLPFIDRSVRAFSLSASPITLRTGLGPLLPIHEAVPQYNAPLEDLTGYGGLPMSGSVSTISLSLARLLGCSPLVLVGQDLAYSGGRTYATGTGYEASRAEVDEGTGMVHLKWNAEVVRVHGEAQGPVRQREELRRVPAWGGQGEVDSGLGFAGVQSWFESTAELLVKSGSSVRLINASEGGVHIKGYEDLPLSQVLEGLVRHDIRPERIAAEAHEAWSPMPSSRIHTWLESHARAAQRVRRAAHRLERYANYASRATLGGVPRSITRAYDRLEQAELQLREVVALCPLVDAWSHRAVDEALLEVGPGSHGPHAEAQAATEKSSRVAHAVKEAARELELALRQAAARLSTASEPSHGTRAI
jgi:6-hydroxymethylpterin diphosphokinase MptE-like protein